MGLKKILKNRKRRINIERFNEIQYDETNKTRGQRIRSWARNESKNMALQVSPIILAASASLANEYMLTREVSPLAWHDQNNDGTLDAIIAFPLKGTNQSVLRWQDGRDLQARGVVPVNSRGRVFHQEFETNIFDTQSLPLQLIDNFYSERGNAGYSVVSTNGSFYIQNEMESRLGPIGSGSQVSLEDYKKMKEEVKSLPESQDETPCIVYYGDSRVPRKLAVLD